VRLLWEAPPDQILLRYEGSFARQDHGDVARQMPAAGMTYLVGAGLVLRRMPLEASGWMERGRLVGRRGNRLTAGDDSEMVLRIRNAGYELWYNPAMCLQHYIPQQRMSLTYLCRLHRGFGRSSPILKTLADNRQPTVTWRVRTLASGVKAFALILLRTAFREARMRRKVSPECRIALYGSLGYLEGAIDSLWQGYQL
jgi:hypothetical protein